jgi:iron(III) transport system ATP-binding protein
VIEVVGLAKSFSANGQGIAAVAGIDFEIKPGEMATLLGPSGCGKTTTLRCLAGLERPDGGRIAIGGQTMADAKTGVFIPPQRRNLGMVFQSYAIWPHMTVLENVAYSLEGRGIGKAERKQLAMEALALVQLAAFAERPLSNLDAKLRIEMRNELRRIQRQTGLTSIYVTHDQAEALAISDLIIVMKDGRIVERGRPVDIYRHPRHVFTAQFLGATNLIAGSVAEADVATGRLVVTTALGRILGIDPTRTLRPGATVVVSIRPEDLSTQASAAGEVNTIEGQMTFAAFAGAAVEAELRCGETKIACLLDRDADLTPGRTVVLRAKPDACLVLPEE